MGIDLPSACGCTNGQKHNFPLFSWTQGFFKTQNTKGGFFGSSACTKEQQTN